MPLPKSRKTKGLRAVGVRLTPTGPVPRDILELTGAIQVSTPDQPDPAERLRALEERLAARRVVQPVKAHGESHYSQAQLAWRMVIELVAGLGIGFGIGYALDTVFGTMPVFLVIFIFFGLAAGVNTMMRSAREVQAKQMAAEAAEHEGETRGR